MTDEEIRNKFPVGAKVRLSVGGPPMAVKSHTHYVGARVTGIKGVVCQWFAGKKLEQGEFSPATLELLDEGGDAPKAG